MLATTSTVPIVGSSRSGGQAPSRSTVVSAPRSRVGQLFVAPAGAILTICFLLPVVIGAIASLTDFDLYGLASIRNVRWIGWDNYTRLLGSGLFWQALRNTLVFVLVAGPLSILVSLTAALLLTARSTWFRGWYRTIHFAPVVSTMVAMAVVWRYLLHAQFGLINAALRLVGLPAIDWLGDPNFSLWGIVLLVVWKSFGLNMVIFIAGIENISRDWQDAAEVDGAGYWQRLRHIVLPALAPTFLFVGITTMVGYLQLFVEPYVMTRGGPLRSTYSLVMFAYEEGFR
ncbi:MAG TPA: sugar ABC transporter permease, partial [Pirellulaceae bacterium]